MIVSPVTTNSAPLGALWTLAVTEVTKKRGGQALMVTIAAGMADELLLEHFISLGDLWSAYDGDELVGFALCRYGVVEALYVERHRRRQGVARALLDALRSLEVPPVDALALPGDRAMKSLYESIGWKARLLTMRGA
ncbi:MAG: GNAT family N-acetyltransferase [Acidimicrobiales bacterium]